MTERPGDNTARPPPSLVVIVPRVGGVASPPACSAATLDPDADGSGSAVAGLSLSSSSICLDHSSSTLPPLPQLAGADTDGSSQAAAATAAAGGCGGRRGGTTVDAVVAVPDVQLDVDAAPAAAVAERAGCRVSVVIDEEPAEPEVVVLLTVFVPLSTAALALLLPRLLLPVSIQECIRVISHVVRFTTTFIDKEITLLCPTKYGRNKGSKNTN